MKQKSPVFFFVLCMCVLMGLVSGSAVFAHGTGVSYEEIKDGYKIDVGHDEFIAALESTRFDFIVYPEDMKDAEGEIFTDVWVTFTKDKKLFFAGGVHKPVFGSTGFTYVFPEQGTYTVSARYQNNGETVVQTEFPIEIIAPLQTKKEPNPFVMYGLVTLAGLLFGIAVGLFIPRNNKKIENI